MSDRIFTKEEYTEKINSLVKPTVEFATITEEFNDRGCFSKEFIKVGDKEVTLAVIDNNWIIVPKDDWDYMRDFERRYYKIKEEFDQYIPTLKKMANRKKFLGIF